MSVRVMSQVWDSDLPPMERLVLLAIADFCDDGGKCWPSVRRIAEKCGMSERGVRKIIRRLEDAGWLATDVGGGRHGCSEYHVKPGTTFPPEPRSPRNQSAETRNQSAQNPEPGSPEPSLTIKEPSEVSKARKIIADVLGDDLAGEFLKHRQAIRKPLKTEHAAKLFVAELAKCDDPIASTNKAILKGWQTVYPEKGNSNGASSRSTTGYADALAKALR